MRCIELVEMTGYISFMIFFDNIKLNNDVIIRTQPLKLKEHENNERKT